MYRLVGAIVLLGNLAAAGAAAPEGSGLCATAAAASGTKRLAVLSAFPAELAPLFAQAVVQPTVVEGRTFFVGELADLRVVMALTGIGMVNATHTTQILLSSFDVAGIVFSGVAGSPHRIGDVTVPTRWKEGDASTLFAVNPALFALARGLPHRLALEHCTPVPPPSGRIVCLPHPPRLRIGGIGHTSDPYGGHAVPCAPGGGDVLGCEVPGASAEVDLQAATVPVAEDMETASMGHVATTNGVPWLAFRAVSDGAGDPLGLPGFPSQFFAYYRLAAENAASAAVALLHELARLGDGAPAHARVCRLLAQARWKAAARLLRHRARSA